MTALHEISTPIGWGLLLCSVLGLGACKKKPSTDSLASSLSSYNFILKIQPGRSIDSLRERAYEDRLLAYALELGTRSRDFNRRLGLIISAVGQETEWHKIVEQVIAMENYREAAAYNQSYLDSLGVLCANPAAGYELIYTHLVGAHESLTANYTLLQDHSSSESFSLLLTRVLSNEQAINSALKEVERQLREKIGMAV